MSTAAEVAAAVAPDPQPETPVVETPIVAPFDPKSIAIPLEHAPKHIAGRLKPGATLADVFEDNLRAQQWGHTNAEEVARLKRENDELRTRQIVRDENERAKPPAPAPNRWEAAGMDPSVAADLGLDKTLTMAEEEIERRVGVRVKPLEDQLSAIQQREMSQAFTITFENARNALAEKGHKFSQEEWAARLRVIAPFIRDNEPEQQFNHGRYVDHFMALAGAAPVAAALPVAPAPAPIVAAPQLLQESAPPLASRPSVIPAQIERTTVSRETREIRKRIASAMPSLQRDPALLKSFLDEPE